MRKILHILLVVAVAVSCHGPRVIPRDKLAQIYYDMFMADQQLREEPALRQQADTMLVYEAVFNRYGYDTDDYLYSVRYYLKDPERFSKTLEEVSARLQGEADALGKVIEHIDWVNGYMGMKRPPVDSVLAGFCDDSLYVGLARVVRDSTRYGGWFRLVPVREDTLMVPVDTTRVEAVEEKEEKPAPEAEVKPAKKPEARKKVSRPLEAGQMKEVVAVEEVVEEEL